MILTAIISVEEMAKYGDIFSEGIFYSLNSFPGKNAILINCDL